jgi:hypothetical protein
MKRKLMPSVLQAIVAALTFFGGLHVGIPEVSSEAAPISGFATPAAASCAQECNHTASDCLDGCEERFKTDDKARVTCKFECANQRQQCEKDCD